MLYWPLTSTPLGQSCRQRRRSNLCPSRWQAPLFAGDIPTVSLDVISLVASRCGYDRGQIESHAAHEFAVHVATQRARAKCRQHRHPPRAQPVAPRRERHCRGPRLPPRRGTEQAPSRDRDSPVAHTGGETTPSPRNATCCAARSSLLFSPPGHGFPHIPPNLVVGRVRRIPIPSRGEDLQIEHPV